MKNYREKIDDIDSELINLLTERFEITRKIGEVKIKEKLPIHNQKREDEIFEKLNHLLEANPNKKYIIEVFQAMIEISKTQQQSLK